MRDTRRVIAVVFAAILAAGAVSVMAHGDGYRASRVQLSGGGAWLASAQQGLVTLIDGASEQVVGSLPVLGARRGDALSVVQSHASAYVVNGSLGTVSRVDGATYKSSAPIRFGDGAGSVLGVFAGGPSLYVVDGRRRTASVTDPMTLQVRERLSLAAQPGPEQSVVDDAGRLWVVDKDRGGLTWFNGGKQVRPDVGDAGTRLVLVRGRPVLVDVARSRIGSLSADGSVGAWSCLEVRSGDKAQVLGSSSSTRVFAAVPATGTLVASAVGRDDCDLSVEVGKAGDRFGPLVESGGFVFVPNQTSGHTIVVDTTAGKVAADLTVVKADSRLELLAKDGFVFYNDLDGDQAGVIKFDGGRWVKGKSLKKYDVSDTGKGILTPDGKKDAAKEPPTEPGEKPGKDPQPGPPGPDENPPPAPPVGPPPPPPPPGGPHGLTVRVDGPGSAFAEDPAPVGLPAGTECPANATCLWRYPAGTRVTVRVPETVGDANLTDLQGCESQDTVDGSRRCVLTLTAPATVHATFKSPTPVRVTLSASREGNGTLTATPAGGPSTPCDPVCGVEVDQGTQVTLQADPAPGNRVFGWTGVTGCGAGDTTCTLAVDADRSVTVQFAAEVFQLTVVKAGQGSGTISGQGLSCDGKGCTGTYPLGTNVSLTANPDGRSTFSGWSGCSPAGSRTCSVRVDEDTRVTVAFDRVPDTTPPNVRLSGGGVTVTPGSGDRTVNISGGNTSISMTATGTDDGSDVTDTSVLFGFVHARCETSDGSSDDLFIDEGQFNPIRSDSDGSVGFSKDLNLCNSNFPVLVSAEGQFKGRATSEGGTATTDTLIVNYTR